MAGCCHFKNNGCFDNTGICEREMDFILLDYTLPETNMAPENGWLE